MMSTTDDEPLWKRLKRTSGEMRSAEDTIGHNNSNQNRSNDVNNTGTLVYSTPSLRVSNPLMITHPSPTLSFTSGSSKANTAAAASNTKIVTSHTTHITMMHQQHQLESLQMQMEHERDKNRLEQKKLQNLIDKLQQQVQLSTKELQQQNELYNETQENYEKQIQDLTTAHRNKLQQNRQLQLQIEQLQYHHVSRPRRQRQKQRRSIKEDGIPNAKDYDDDDDDDDEEDAEEEEEFNNDEMIDAELHTYQVLNQRLQKQIQNYAHNETLYQQEIQQLKQSVQEKLHTLQEDHDAQRKVQDENQKLYEEAPKTILQELNTCRIQLTTAERQVRQLERQTKYEQEQYTTLLKEKETLNLQNHRYEQIQDELYHIRKKYAQMEAENLAYQDFTKQVYQIVNDDTKRHGTSCGPPELATIIRFLENAKRHSVNTTQDKMRVSDTHEQNATTTSEESIQPQWTQKQQREYEIELLTLQKKYDTANHQMKLYQREIESYKSLMQTYEQQMILLSPTKAKMPQQQRQQQNDEIHSNNILNVELDQLKIEYSSMKELNGHLQQSNNSLLSDLNACRKELSTKQSEYDVLRTKYQQIKDALQVEKDRHIAIEQQLIVAEQLAGKGSFDQERTRILHITETPLIQALKEEISVLKRQVETLLQQKLNTISSPSDSLSLDTSTLMSTSTTSTIPNPEKVIQRLKEQFKEQIGMFREGVYIMTGFKIDMIYSNQSSAAGTSTGTPGDDSSKSRPMFRLRSVFAEHEEDQLLLQWPTSTTNKKSLDILQTEFAKYLSSTSCYDYIAKLHSIPAFLASVQLMLFEKQTVMM